jgi:Raf kinase inhibitor-like YbhB/YbcL family protein
VAELTAAAWLVIGCGGRVAILVADTEGGSSGTASAGTVGVAGIVGVGGDCICDFSQAGTVGIGVAGGGGRGDTAGAGGSAGGSGAGGGGTAAFTLTSSAFSDMGQLGAQYQCGVTGVSPPLSWTAVPPGTESYAIVMVGPDSTGAGSYYHWVIWDIPATTTGLPEAVAQMAMPSVPAGSQQISPGIDGATWPGYAGPCPPIPIAYTFTVFALNVAVLPDVTPASTGAAVFAAIQANAITSAQLTALADHYKS